MKRHGCTCRSQSQPRAEPSQGAAEQPGGIWPGKGPGSEAPIMHSWVSYGYLTDAEQPGLLGQAALQAEALRLCPDGHRSGAVQAWSRQPPRGRPHSREQGRVHHVFPTY